MSDRFGGARLNEIPGAMFLRARRLSRGISRVVSGTWRRSQEISLGGGILRELGRPGESLGGWPAHARLAQKMGARRPEGLMGRDGLGRERIEQEEAGPRPEGAAMGGGTGDPRADRRRLGDEHVVKQRQRPRVRSAREGP
jgi:hypothetical protein